MKKYLSIVSLIYSSIIIYIFISDKLSNYLAPSMYLNLIIAIILLVIITIISLLSKSHYTFNYKDLILLLPLLTILLSQDGVLSTTFASSRINNYSPSREITEESTNKIDIDQIDISKIDFDISDAAYAEVANYLTFHPNAKDYENKTIKVNGFSILNNNLVPNGYFALGKYLISCCAADSEFVGFIIKYDTTNIKDNAWYEVEGILRKGKDNEGYDIMYIEVVNLKEIDTQKQYVYPCYSYDDGLCSEISKYNLKY